MIARKIWMIEKSLNFHTVQKWISEQLATLTERVHCWSFTLEWLPNEVVHLCAKIALDTSKISRYFLCEIMKSQFWCLLVLLLPITSRTSLITWREQCQKQITYSQDSVKKWEIYSRENSYNVYNFLVNLLISRNF